MSKYEKQVYNKERGVYREMIPTHSEDWYKRRLQGIGSTDIGRILGFNEYEGGSCIEIFMEKIGLREVIRESNKNTYWGKEMEELVAQSWKYYDGTKYGYIKNKEEGKLQRECRNLSGVFTNEKYPDLYTSIDRMINKGQFKISDGTILHENALLEIKTASSWVAKKWEFGLDPMYIMQVMQQMMVMGIDYTEVATFELDPREFVVYAINLDPNLVNQIEEQSYTFWNKLVIPARELVMQRKLALAREDFHEAEKLMAEIERYEPAADGSERYKEFMNQRWLSEARVLRATDDDIRNVKELKFLKSIQLDVEEAITLRENIIRETLREDDTLDCLDYGQVTWRSEKRARVLRTQGFRVDPSQKELVLDVKEFINQYTALL